MRSTLTPEERCEEILYILRMRKQVNINDLVSELKVSARTIKYDIEVLTDKGLVKTSRGKYGGIELVGSYPVKFLAQTQLNLLEKCKENLNGYDLEVLESIIYIL